MCRNGKGEQKERLLWDLPLHRQTTVHTGLGRHLGCLGHNLSSPSLKEELLLFINFLFYSVAPGTCLQSPVPCAVRRVPSCGAATGRPPAPQARSAWLRTEVSRLAASGPGLKCPGGSRARLLGTEWPAVPSSGEPLAPPPQRGRGLKPTFSKQRGPHSPLSVSEQMDASLSCTFKRFHLAGLPRLGPLSWWRPDMLPDAAPHQTHIAPRRRR